MEQIGVEAVVEGLSSFLGDMGQVNGALDSLRPHATLLQQAFGWVGDQLGSFSDSVINVAEYTLGGLLKDAIEGTISLLGDLGKSAITAGENFQLLQIRLNGINLQDALKSTNDYTTAMKIAETATQDQITWIQKLAVSTPFDATDINTIYFLARSYGYADTAARTLTTDTLDYAAGMGLTTDRLENMIQDLGTMVARGKITGTALRTLTNSAYLPLNDILGRIAANMGISTEALKKQISTADGVPADEFVKAYEQMVEEEPRFNGASDRMNKAFTVSIENMRDVVQNVGGKNIMQPILDSLGNFLSGIVEKFQEDKNWQALTAAAQRIGDSVAGILNKIFGLLPDSQGVVDTIIGGLSGMADWLDTHKDDIVTFIQNAATWITNVLIPDLMGIANWFITNWPTISAFAGTVVGIIAELINRWFGGVAGKAGGIGDAIVTFMNFVIDHKEDIVNFLDKAGKLWLAWEIGATIINLIVGALIWLVGIAIGVVVAILSIIAIIGTLGGTIGWIVAIIAGLITSLTGTTIQIYGTQAAFDFFRRGLDALVASPLWQGLAHIAANTIKGVQDAFTGKNWLEIGMNIIKAIGDGIQNMKSYLIDAAVAAAVAAYEAILHALGIASPSTLFFEIGEMSMMGMAQGIEKFAGLAESAMQRAAMMTASPAMWVPAMAQSYASGGSMGNSVSTTYNQNLTIHSSANTEPIINDFGMMRSLAGGG